MLRPRKCKGLRDRPAGRIRVSNPGRPHVPWGVDAERHTLFNRAELAKVRRWAGRVRAALPARAALSPHHTMKRCYSSGFPPRFCSKIVQKMPY